METTQKSRNISIDLLKCVAVSFVILTHLFAQSKFFDEPLHGISGAIAISFRTLCLTCTPLFLVATGFLMKDKRLDVRYYRGILRTLLIYVLVSLFRMYSYGTIGYPENWTGGISFNVIRELLDIGYTGYTWYIEMYIGLFLLIPFLNILYKELGTKRNRLLLLATLFFMVSLPTQINVDIQVVPNWWSSSLFPIMYYFIGSYFRDYPISLSPVKSFLLLLAATGLVGLFNTLMCYHHFDHYYGYPVYTDNQGSLELVFLTVSVLTFIHNIQLPRADSLKGRVITQFSKWSLGAYLSSWVFNKCVLLEGSFSSVPFIEQLVLLLPFFLIVAIPSFLVSSIVTWLSDVILGAALSASKNLT